MNSHPHTHHVFWSLTVLTFAILMVSLTPSLTSPPSVSTIWPPPPRWQWQPPPPHHLHWHSRHGLIPSITQQWQWQQQLPPQHQQSGHAGQTGPGKCYCLYTKAAYHNEMLPTLIPDIQRTNLAHTILMLKAMDINDLLSFDLIDPLPVHQQWQWTHPLLPSGANTAELLHIFGNQHYITNTTQHILSDTTHFW